MPVPELSPTEERIVLLLAQGRSKSEIAAAVGLDARTVDWHLTQANGKLAKASALLERVRRRERRKEQEKCADTKSSSASRG